MANILHLNTLLGIMVMMLLDHCLKHSQMTGYINEFDEDKNKKELKITIK